MGLLNKKNITMAKNLALKNKGKIAPVVTKATSAIDKKTGGKHADKLKKLDDAAAKLSGTTPAPGAPVAPESTKPGPMPAPMPAPEPLANRADLDAPTPD